MGKSFVNILKKIIYDNLWKNPINDIKGYWGCNGFLKNK
jgi:hypothetical protein